MAPASETGFQPTDVSTICSTIWPVWQTTYTHIDNATLWARIETNHNHQELTEVLNETPEVEQSFCINHLVTIFLFDSDMEAHMAHMHMVFHMLTANGMTGNPRATLIGAPDAAKAGLQIDKVGSLGLLLVVDLGMPPSSSDIPST
ncbi:hypothetical protein LTR37_000756 [Vermiconidia calcicola]|uniref:Uncharacterized protein n=1 Tax=Vermiconidia calcicola TaxID=1690605 RepID=A0ACC3NYH2_9PEZI|nr:hypothetical protein LTR37_000756 [Vermiconidia calcicola]